MAQRVLSGLILPKAGFRQAGTATIDFSPHSISGDVIQPGREDMAAFGPNDDFNSEPCKTVSLRRVIFSDQDHSRPRDAVNVDRKEFDIGDDYHRAGGKFTSLVVNWDTDGRGAEIREISYMIIGETD
jgi:hypothetical protein